MPRGKSAKKSSMRGKGGLKRSRTMIRGREGDKKVAGEVTPRATSRARGATLEKVAVRTGRMAGIGGKASKASKASKPSKASKGSKSIMGKRRPRKSDI